MNVSKLLFFLFILSTSVRTYGIDEDHRWTSEQYQNFGKELIDGDGITESEIKKLYKKTRMLKVGEYEILEKYETIENGQEILYLRIRETKIKKIKNADGTLVETTDTIDKERWVRIVKGDYPEFSDGSAVNKITLKKKIPAINNSAVVKINHRREALRREAYRIKKTTAGLYGRPKNFEDKYYHRPYEPQNPEPYECSATENLDYESCSSSNNQIENGISDALNKGRCFPPSENFSAECVLAAQDIFPSAKSLYGTCRDPNGKPTKGGSKPCSSRNYVNCVAGAYEAAADCMGIDPKLMFPLLAHESGFQINAMSQTGAAGTGQMTQIAIKDVNTRGQKYLDKIKNSDKPSCKKIASLVPKKGSVSDSFSKRCQFMTPPESPMTSFMYNAALNRIQENEIRNFLNSKRSQLKGFSDEQFEILVNKLTMLSYNAGSGTVRSVMRSYLNSSRTPSSFNLSSNNSSFVRYIRDNASGSYARKKEISQYMPKISNKMTSIDKAVGAGECTQPNMF